MFFPGFGKARISATFQCSRKYEYLKQALKMLVSSKIALLGKFLRIMFWLPSLSGAFFDLVFSIAHSLSRWVINLISFKLIGVLLIFLHSVRTFLLFCDFPSFSVK